MFECFCESLANLLCEWIVWKQTKKTLTFLSVTIAMSFAMDINPVMYYTWLHLKKPFCKYLGVLIVKQFEISWLYVFSVGMFVSFNVCIHVRGTSKKKPSSSSFITPWQPKPCCYRGNHHHLIVSLVTKTTSPSYVISTSVLILPWLLKRAKGRLGHLKNLCKLRTLFLHYIIYA